MRDIGSRVRVVEGDGRRLLVDRVWLERETDVMQTLPMLTAVNGEEYFQLQGELEDELLDEKNRARRRLTVYFPHINRTEDLYAGNGLLREWLKLLNNKRDMDTEAAWERHPGAMRAAGQLVQLTGLVPGGDSDLSATTSSGVL